MNTCTRKNKGKEKINYDKVNSRKNLIKYVKSIEQDAYYYLEENENEPAERALQYLSQCRNSLMTFFDELNLSKKEKQGLMKKAPLIFKQKSDK